MKIIIIGPAYPYRGGLAAYNERLAREFIAEGHDVSIHTFTLQYPSILFPGKSQYSTEEKPSGLNIFRSINSINPVNWINIGNKLRQEKADLVIVRFWLPFMGPCFGKISRQIKKNNKSRIICLVDNMIPHEPRIGDKLLTKYFIKPIDAFLAMSQSVMTDIEIFDKTKKKLLSPHPLFDNFGEALSRKSALQKLGIAEENRYILFFGLIRKYKGLDLLLEAFSDKRFRKTNIKLIIAGEYYTDSKMYTDIIKKNNLENDVIQIAEFIPDSNVKLFFSAVDLVVQPYKTATQSGVTQIAYHFNKPMIVTNVGGLPELCPDNKVGFVVPTNPEEIANAILKYYKESHEESFISNIKEEKKKYSWKVLVDNILKLHEII